MKNTLKIVISIIGLLAIFTYLGKEYGCIKECVFYDVGKFLGAFLVISFLLLFIDEIRNKIIDLWKIYVPAMFLLYSAIYYIDTTQHQENLKIKKEYLEFKLKLTSTKFENIEKEEFNKVIEKDLSLYNDAFDKYANELLNSYKEIVGKAMIGLNIAIMTIVSLTLLDWYFRRKEKKKLLKVQN